MVSKKGSLGFCSVLVLLIVLGVQYSENKIRSTNENTPLFEPVLYYNHTWNSIGNDIPPCQRPMVYRNAFKYPENCKDINQCNDLIMNQLVKTFGDRYVQTIIPGGTREAIHIPLKEYVLNPKYKNHSVHTFHGLGSYEEYQQFFSFNSTLPSNEYSKFLRPENDHFYLGSQIFMNRGIHKGSQLHLAVGHINMFTMLSGRKRWLLVSPFYLSKLNCSKLISSTASNCAPGGYFPYFKNVDIDKYKTIMTNISDIPKEYIVDVVLNPGDVLINCVAWPHAIENLDEVTSAFSIRLIPKFAKRTTSWYNIGLMSESIRDSIYFKFTNPTKFTTLDSFYHIMIKGEFDYVDKFLGGKTVIRQQNVKEDNIQDFN